MDWFPAVPLSLLISYVTLTYAQTQGSQVCLMVPPETEECYRSFDGTPISGMSAQVACLRKLLWKFRPDRNMTQEDLQVIRSLRQVAPNTVSAAMSDAQAFRGGLSGYRYRQEYRTLSAGQRQRLHRVLNILHQNGTIRTFAHIHAQSFGTIHRGASFLPWHRVFLFFFEEKLREIDPTVSLPYWDSTADDEMANPVLSMLWTDSYFGPGLGEVSSGPFAGWVTDNGRLERNYGSGTSRLMKKSDVRSVLRKCYLREISRPTGEQDDILERYHDGVHRFVGGDMASAASPYDPIFYMHHAYIDLIWEQFRINQRRRCRVDPETDYPTDTTPGHGAQDRMAGFEWLRNIDGCSDFWTRNFYSYRRPPICPFCRGPALYCSRRRWVCVARRRDIIPFNRAGVPRSTTEIRAASSSFFAEVSRQETTFVPKPGRDVFNGPPPDRSRYTIVRDLERAERLGLSEATDAMPSDRVRSEVGTSRIDGPTRRPVTSPRVGFRDIIGVRSSVGSAGVGTAEAPVSGLGVGPDGTGGVIGTAAVGPDVGGGPVPPAGGVPLAAGGPGEGTPGTGFDTPISLIAK